MKTKKLLALVLAVLMLLSIAPTAVLAAGIPEITNFRMSNVENGVSDGAFEMQWTMLDDMSRMLISGGKVMYSTDQTNWKLAYETGDRYVCSAYIKSFDDGTKPIPGTTYYFYACYIGKNGEEGPRSNIISSKFADSETAAQQEFDQLKRALDSFKPVEKSKNYDKVNLKKGVTLVWDSSLYTLTAVVTAVKCGKATVKTTMKNKIGGGKHLFYVGYISSEIKPGLGSESSAVTENSKGVATRTFTLADLKEGATKIRISVKCGVGYEYNNCSGYRDYMDDLTYFNEDHEILFQNAPATPYLDFRGQNLKVNSTAISFGTAYKSNAKGLKGSGTIVFYKPVDAKKWSKKAFAGGKTIKITKLQPNTVYQLRTVNFVKSVSAADGKTVVTSKSGYSNVMKLRTGIGAAPEIKSIKVTSKVVTIHHKAQWNKRGSTWYYTEAYDSKQTNFTVKVTLKEAVPGMAALQCAGLGALNTEIRDGKGTTFTFSGNRAGSVKGKSISLSFLSYTNKLGSGWYVGTSPALKKSVTL